MPHWWDKTECRPTVLLALRSLLRSISPDKWHGFLHCAASNQHLVLGHGGGCSTTGVNPAGDAGDTSPQILWLRGRQRECPPTLLHTLNLVHENSPKYAISGSPKKIISWQGPGTDTSPDPSPGREGVLGENTPSPHLTGASIVPQPWTRVDAIVQYVDNLKAWTKDVPVIRHSGTRQK